MCARRRFSWGLIGLVLAAGCHTVLPSRGGGQTAFSPPRPIDVGDVAVPAGYRIEAMATGLTFPTAVAFDDAGAVYVVESGYAYGPVKKTPRLLRVGPHGRTEIVAAGREGPWTGIAFVDGAFYVAQGSNPGKLLRIERDGAVRVIVDGLPSKGDHHTDGPALGPDGKLYFGQGTITNSGVVGVDNYKFGWLAARPDLHDVPCRDVRVAGATFETENPLTDDDDDRATTSPFMPFGQTAPAGTVVHGRVPCSGAIFRVDRDGGAPELVAWGFRNPFGLHFGPRGRLFVTENGFDVRGSRPIYGAGDHLWAVDVTGPVRWYGWPDFSGGRPVTAPGYQAPFEPAPAFVLAEHPQVPPKPIAEFAVHASANGFDIARDDAFGPPGLAYVALFGDMAPTVGKVLSPVGFRVVTVNLADGLIQEFLSNHGETTAPASWNGGGGLERPVDVKFSPDGRSLYVVDFGVVRVDDDGAHPYAGTGVLWRVTHTGAARVARGAP